MGDVPYTEDIGAGARCTSGLDDARPGTAKGLGLSTRGRDQHAAGLAEESGSEDRG
jgi:hypothetical protein